jgi:hypothetical protein
MLRAIALAALFPLRYYAFLTDGDVARRVPAALRVGDPPMRLQADHARRRSA